MEKALSIPEIRKHIGYFLSIRDLKACMTVSKVWAESMAPWLWWSATIQKTNDPASVETISKYAPHVRFLYLDRVDLGKDRYALFHCLQTLEFRGLKSSSLQDEYIALIHRNWSTLRSLTAEDCREIPTAVLRAAINSPVLKSLSLSEVMFREKKLAEELIQTCTRLSRLMLTMDNWSDWSLLWTSSQEFPQLKFLCLSTLTRPDQLRILRSCPNLRTLVISLRNTISTQELAEVLLPSCPKLHSFFYDHSRNVTADDLNKLLESLPLMKCLQIGTSRNWLNCISPPISYSRHFASLQAILFTSLQPSTSTDIQTILCSCPNLRYINGGHVLVSDIDPERPWVCLQLEHFGVIALEQSEEIAQQSILYRQLARLTQLRVLFIGRRIRTTQHRLPRILGLEGGLELLEPLKRLVHLDFSSHVVDWREEEIEWVIQAWPNLYSIRGSIHEDESKRFFLWERLRSAGILSGNFRYDFWDFIDVEVDY